MVHFFGVSVNLVIVILYIYCYEISAEIDKLEFWGTNEKFKDMRRGVLKKKPVPDYNKTEKPPARSRFKDNVVYTGEFIDPLDLRYSSPKQGPKIGEPQIEPLKRVHDDSDSKTSSDTDMGHNYNIEPYKNKTLKIDTNQNQNKDANYMKDKYLTKDKHLKESKDVQNSKYKIQDQVDEENYKKDKDLKKYNHLKESKDVQNSKYKIQDQTDEENNKKDKDLKKDKHLKESKDVQNSKYKIQDQADEENHKKDKDLKKDKHLKESKNGQNSKYKIQDQADEENHKKDKDLKKDKQLKESKNVQNSKYKIQDQADEENHKKDKDLKKDKQLKESKNVQNSKYKIHDQADEDNDIYDSDNGSENRKDRNTDKTHTTEKSYKNYKDGNKDTDHKKEQNKDKKLSKGDSHENVKNEKDEEEQIEEIDIENENAKYYSKEKEHKKDYHKDNDYDKKKNHQRNRDHRNSEENYDENKQKENQYNEKYSYKNKDKDRVGGPMKLPSSKTKGPKQGQVLKNKWPIYEQPSKIKTNKHHTRQMHIIESTRMTPMYLMQQEGEGGGAGGGGGGVTITTPDFEHNPILFLSPYSLKAQILKLCEEYPKISVTTETLGRTVEYNDIVLFKIAQRSDSGKYFRAEESKYVDEMPEKKIVFIVHGLSVMGIQYIQPLCSVTGLRILLTYYLSHLDKFDIYFMPMANPDGYSASFSKKIWNKNMSPQAACPGVSLDRNFDVAWNASRQISSCSQMYPGHSPFSEVESKAIRDVFHYHGHKIIAYIHVHAGTYNAKVFKGDAILYPRGYSDSQSDDDRYIDLKGEIDEAMKNASFRVLSVTVDTLYNWYGKVMGTSVDYASTVYGIPYALEFVMQKYEGDNGGETNEFYALTEIWSRLIVTTFNNMWKTLHVNNDAKKK